MTSTTTARGLTKALASVATVAALSLSLTACGSGPESGTYFAEGLDGTSDLGMLTVDGDGVKHQEFNCDGPLDYDGATSTGEFNEDLTQVKWLVVGDDPRNDRTGTEQVAIADESITIGEHVYLKGDSDAGKALLDGYKNELTTDAHTCDPRIP